MIIAGGNLEEAVLKGRLPLGNALDALVQVGDALAYAHRKKVFHRDVKPSNILLTSSGEAKLSTCTAVSSIPLPLDRHVQVQIEFCWMSALSARPATCTLTLVRAV